MKKRFVKFLKGLVVFLLLFATIVIIALLWPLPHLEPAVRYDRIVVKSINVVDVETGNILENRNILIVENKVVRIDSLEIPRTDSSTLHINGANKYLIPGLWDMHTHSTQHSPWLHHPLYIANGVTGVRDMSGQLDRYDSYWSGSVERLRWNAELDGNGRVTPRYVLQSSYQLDGAASVPDGFPEFFKLSSPKDVDSLLRFYKKQHVDFIKVYQQIPHESYKHLALKAPEYNLHLAGHKPMFVSLENAVEWGQRSFEHGRIFLFESFPGAKELRASKDWKGYFSKSKKSMVDDFDAVIAKELMLLMKHNNAHWVPTLQTLKFEAYAHKPGFIENPNLKYVTMVRKKLWWGNDTRNNARRNLSEKSRGLSQAIYDASRQQIKMAHDIGVPLMTGTDVTDSYVFAGFSLHDELEGLTQCGLSNLEALKSATIIPARFAGLGEQYGSTEVGKVADLVILNQNPLQHITNTRTIQGVILNGLYYDSDKIQELKKFTESNASSFHVNIKTFFSLFNSPLIRVQFAD